MKKLTKAERFVIVIGTLLIVALLVLGLLKSKFIDSKKEPFTATGTTTTNTSTNTTIDGITSKQSPYVIEAGKTLSKDVSTYIKASDTILESAKIDVSKVDTKKPGTYTATISYDGKTMSQSIQVKDTTGPVITADYSEVTFTLEETSTLQELISFVNAKAVDAVDGTIDSVKGWPTELPKEAATLTYTITATDSAGNTTKKEILVQYVTAQQPVTGN